MTADYTSERARILVGDVRDRLEDLPDDSVHTVVTSPPYWGLRDYHVDGQIGLEEEMREHVAELVRVFRDVRRILRPDGTLFLNYGDSYAGTGNGGGDDLDDAPRAWANQENNSGWTPPPGGLKEKDLIGLPWRVAFALQRDGWHLRSDIVWHKPNPMPESVTDRPTRAHEFIFLLTPDPSYFYDADAIREPYADSTREDRRDPDDTGRVDRGFPGSADRGSGKLTNGLGANKRDVLEVANNGYADAHFATFPPELVRPWIRAGASQAGCCPKCGAPLERLTEKEGQGRVRNDAGGLHGNGRNGGGKGTVARMKWREEVVRHTVGWQPTCEHDVTPDGADPCTVLDPFLGAGTTSLVALEEGHHAIGVELNPDYAEMAWERIRDLAETPRLDTFAQEARSP